MGVAFVCKKKKKKKRRLVMFPVLLEEGSMVLV